MKPQIENFKAIMVGVGDGTPGMLEQLGMSVAQFALAVGVTRASVYYYLKGTAYPSSQTLHRMASVLGIPSEELFKLVPTREAGTPKGSKNAKKTK